MAKEAKATAKTASSVAGETTPETKEARKQAVALFNVSTVYTTVKAIDGAITKAHASTKDIQLEYQRIAVSVIMLLEKNRDISIVRNLFNRMTKELPESLRLDTMQAFFAKYASVKFDDLGEVYFDKTKDCDVSGAMTHEWWKAIKRKTPQAFDLDAELAKLYERALKRKENPKQDDNGALLEDNIPVSTLNALKRAMSGGNVKDKAA